MILKQGLGPDFAHHFILATQVERKCSTSTAGIAQVYRSFRPNLNKSHKFI